MIDFNVYELPLKTPFRIAGATYASRKGIIVSDKRTSTVYYSEIAPLPGFSAETYEEVIEFLMDHKAGKNEWDDLAHAPFASIRFGYDMIRLQRKAKEAGLPFRYFLRSDCPDYVPINGLVGSNTPELMLKQAESLIEQGFSTIKIKVGLQPEKEIELIHALSANYPKLKLRLDANQAFSKEQALQFFESLKGCNIDYCEQPVAASDLDALKWVHDRSSVRIAADEAVQDKQAAQTIIQENLCDVVMLKPMLLGSVDEITSLITLAQKAKISTVFTTLMESCIGRYLIAHLAAAFSQDGETPHGLNTGTLFLMDLHDCREHISDAKYFITNG